VPPSDTAVLVLVPVLGRPQRVEPFLESLRGSLRPGEGAQALFLVTASDVDELAAVRAAHVRHLIVPWEAGDGDYARKINAGFQIGVEDGWTWMLQAADDLKFHGGWLGRALQTFKRSGACVIGTNDRGNRAVIAGRHSTHSLIHADYLKCGTVDEDARILHEGYTHNFVDNEFVETAAARGTFAFSRASIIEHLHPNWKKGEMDDTYRKGLADFERDRSLYQRRRRLWTGRRR
jgi:hypothetical protein